MEPTVKRVMAGPVIDDLDMLIRVVELSDGSGRSEVFKDGRWVPGSNPGEVFRLPLASPEDLRRLGAE